ncbi:MAG: hypothetical protein CL946_03615 [Ectothiorhodospiraceae bacterium]|nr:hypothetical protein [Ectothiorhodospiraceae bacterium]
MSNEEKQWNYEKILDRLNEVRTKEENVRLFRGVCIALAVAIPVLLLIFALEAVFHLGITGRTVMFAFGILTLAGALAGFIGPALLIRFNLLARKSLDAIALQVGKHFPDLQDRLLNVLQVYREQLQHRDLGYSKALIDASFADIASKFSSTDIEPVIDRKPVKTAGKYTLYSIVAAFVAFAAFPSTMFDAAGRVMQFGTDFTPPAPFEFIVEPGDIEAVKGQPVTLRARTTSYEDITVNFQLKEDGQDDFDAVNAVSDSAGDYLFEIDDVRSTFTYYAEAKGYRSKMFTVSVVDRPLVRNMRIGMDFPSYTGLSDRVLDDNTGDITALAGTKLSYELQLNKEVASARIVYSDSEEVALQVEGKSAFLNTRLMKNRSYHFELTDQAGIESINPITYSMTVVPDMNPAIEVVEPERLTELDEDMRVPIVALISDDFGFSKLKLHYRLAASRYEPAQENYKEFSIPVPVHRKSNGTVELEVPYIWNVTGMNLAPEDVVNYYLEIFDNDVVRGPKSARSEIFTLRLPSMEEIFARADKTQDKAIDDLEKTLQKAQEVQKALDDVEREMKSQNTKKLDWQQQKKVEEAMKRQKELLDEVSKVKEDMRKLAEDLQKQDALSKETLDKYQEFQELMQQIDSPDFEKYLKKMNEAMKQVSPEQLQKAMENFKFSEDQFRNSLERSIELLKRLQIEQKVDELTKRSKELADKQEELAEKTENADPNDQEQLDQLAQEQRDLQKQLDAMQKEMDQLSEMMKQFPKEMPLEEMQDAQSEMNLQQMQQQMSESASQCQGGNCKKASLGQKKMAQQMRNVQKKMEKVKQKMTAEQQRMVQNTLKKTLDNLLELSKKQEKLKNEIAQLPMNSQQFREKAPQQAELMDELNKSASELMELAKKSFSVDPKMMQHMGDAMKQMQESMEKMGRRDKQGTGEKQGGAMQALNEAAKRIADGMNSQGGSSSSGSLMQQLMKMAQQQQGINSQMPMPGGKMSQQQMARMQRLMSQQLGVQKSLQQLNEEARKSRDGEKLLGDLDRIAEEMQEVVRDMQQDNINPETIEKQERILSRLLDASRSMRERDYEKKRKSRTGEDIVRQSPSDLNLDALRNGEGLKYDLQRAIDEGYNRDYENLIRDYFEALEQEIPQL